MLANIALSAGPVAVTRVAGELDLLTGPALAAHLAAALDRVPSHLVIDVAGVQFCGARGLALLADTARAATTAGIGYALAGTSPQLDRVIGLTWDEAPVPWPRYPSTAAAVAAIRAHPEDCPA